MLHYLQELQLLKRLRLKKSYNELIENPCSMMETPCERELWQELLGYSGAVSAGTMAPDEWVFVIGGASNRFA